MHLIITVKTVLLALAVLCFVLEALHFSRWAIKWWALGIAFYLAAVSGVIS